MTTYTHPETVSGPRTLSGRGIVQSDIEIGVKMWFALVGLPIRASYTVAEVERLLHVSNRTVYDMLADGRLPALQIPRTKASEYVTPARIPYPALAALLPAKFRGPSR